MSVPLRVIDFLSTDLITVKADDEITRVVSLLVELDISGVPVVDENGDLVGILTERDCIAEALHAGYFDQLGGAVRDFMSTPVETVTIDDSLVDVANRFVSSIYRRFPVLDDEGHLVGLISRRDVLKALLSGAWFKKPTSAA